ncbi:aldolase/citrate lyase family protein [uncultured Bradyrhizobium sp.]|uniref:HpcH/HpaI aldolase family protein n=1 Tax=Bradyrhizobium sp. TaxID=376 RepID=UPI00262CEAC5|nr:aldolase/citrate lyase family protein [uncultured Bradyrhizobium sp.]
MTYGKARQRRNAVKHAIAEGKVALGIGVQTNSADMVEMAAAADFDFVYLDLEHGSFGFDSAIDLIRAAEASGITPLVRVPDHTPSSIMRVLDAGAMGVIVPNVKSAAEAQSAVSAAKYAWNSNGGSRGACPGTRATWHQVRDWADFSIASNNETSVWLLLETPEALQAVDAIVEVPGIDAIMLGPFDLAHALGLPGQTKHEVVLDACRQISAKARKGGIEIVWTMFSGSMNHEERELIDAMNARIVIAGTDRRIVMTALREMQSSAT